MIHVIGDSHVMVFSGKEHIPDEVDDRGFLPFFRTYRLGPYTAYHAEKLRSLIESIVRQNVEPDDSVMLCFGEIDCRAHLVKQSEQQGRPLDDIVAECVSRYARLFDIKEKYGARLLVWNVPAATLEDIELGEYSTHGTFRQRNEAARLFNQVLEEECKRREIGFVSIFDKLIDPDGLTKVEYYADSVHLSQRAIPLILDELRRLKILTTPLTTEKYDQTRLAEGRDRPGQRIDMVSRGKSVLVCCGIPDFARLVAARPGYDRCYVIEAEKTYADYAKALYGDDRGVSVVHASSINLPALCRENGIEKIDKLIVDTRTDDIAVIQSINRLIRKKNVLDVECRIPRDRLRDISKLFGDAYDVVPASQPGRTASLVNVRCRLKGRQEADGRRDRNGPLFNIVYRDLAPEHEHSIHRGSVSIIWSPLPLAGCDLYFYLNAYSFTGRQEGLNVLYLCEPSVVLPLQYSEAIWRNFDHVVTHYDPLLRGRANFTKALVPQYGIHVWPIVFGVTETMDERDRKYPLVGRNPGICMINGNKSSGVKGELYSKRAETALWFHEHSNIPFDVFGNPPFSLPNYRGALPQDQKLTALSRYRYNLCFENVYHPTFSMGYVDKILNCLETRTIPIYLGADNIDAYVPRECFIDFRAFRDYRELERFLTAMSEKQYRDCVAAIDEFVINGGLQPYTWNTLYDQLVQIHAMSQGKSVAGLYGHGTPWEFGLAEGMAGRDFHKIQGEFPWSFGQLSNYAGEVLIGEKRTVPRSGGGENVVDQLVGTAIGTPKKPSSTDSEKEMELLRVRMDSGFADVNDYYRYAQLLILGERFDEAIPVLHKVVSLLPSHVYALNDIGVIYFRRGQSDEALGYWRRALDVQPDNQNTLRNLLQVLKTLKRDGEMADLGGKTLQRLSGSDEALSRALVVLREFGLPKEQLDPSGRAGRSPAGNGRQERPQTKTGPVATAGTDYYRRPTGRGEGDSYYVHKTAQLERPELIAIGKNAEIKDYVIIRTYENPVTIGQNTQLNPFTVIYGGSGVHIGDNVLIAPHCMIAAGNHDYVQTDVPMRFAGNLTKGPIVIDDNVWIGANVTVADGVKIGRDAVVAANSLVNRDVEPYTIVGGVPAKMIGQRGKGKIAGSAAGANAVPQSEASISSSVCEILPNIGNGIPLAEIYNFNQADRDTWVNERARNIPRGSKVLDVGAGTCPYRTSFAHCDYKTHDFKKYEGVKLGNTNEYGKIDYESDITAIPVPDESFDVVLCTEVLEHVVQPEKALQEMARILKPGGRLLLTAPLGSGLHQLPYHYYGGFTPQWYEHFLPEFGLAVREIRPNGGFFKLLSQECARLTCIVPKEHPLLGTKGSSVHRLFGEWIPRFLYALDKDIRVDQFTVGYHVEAVKEGRSMSVAADSAGRTDDGAREGRSRGELLNSNGNRLAALVFSKDRAMQLDCTLRTLHLHCKDIGRADITVIYTTSSDVHEKGYRQLTEDFPSITFVREGAFKNDVMSVISSFDHVLFLVDDNIFVRDFTLEETINVLSREPAAAGASLRLGRNTTYCYMLDKPQRLPVFDDAGNGLLSFDWTTSEHDFGYPLEVSSSLYRASDILPLLTGLAFANPNSLEALLEANKHIYRHDRPRLLCFGTSVAFCNPVNKVQSICFNNRAGKDKQQGPDNLAAMFLKGHRIDVDRYAGFTPNSCHQEVKLHFVKKDGRNEAASAGPLVSIVILNRNNRREIEACLDSIARNTPESHEVIVLDNGSTDGSLDYLRSRADTFLIESSVNIGVAPGRAKAMAHAHGKHVVLLDNDTVVTAGWIAGFLAHVDSNKQIGIIGPRSNYVSGMQLVPEARYGNVAELEEFARRWRGEHQGQTSLTSRLVGFCMFITRDVLDKIGSIDASFGKFGFEDDDYTIRANIAGFKTIIANDVFIHHSGGPQGRGNEEYNVLLMEAWKRFKEKWGIPMETPYGTSDLTIVSGEFDVSKHFIPFMRVNGQGGLATSYGKRAERESGGPVAPSGDSVEDHLKRAQEYEKGGSIDLAIQELERVVEIDERHAEAFNDLGVLYYRKGDRQKALHMLSNSVMAEPGNVTHLKNLASLALELGETEDAIGLYGRILARQPGDVESLLVVGRLCEQCGQRENAMLFLQRALENEPGNAKAIEAVERLRKQGTRDEAAASSAQDHGPESAAAG